MKPRILLVEDEPGLILTLSDLLAGEGYEVESATDGPAGLARATAESFDAILLDVMLPGMSGFDVCRELRKRGNRAGILMLTARGQLPDRVAGLRLGADDYLAKPFEVPELLARLAAVLRRVAPAQPAALIEFQFGSIAVNFKTEEVHRDGSRIPLPGKELQLLRYLIDHRDTTVSREELLEAVWQYQPGVSSRTVDVHVAWLRQKLEENPQTPRYIHTVRGVGYRFSA
jgi:two-component system, OmpR family, alkaline phosphatase synthesis response regulator PhoP